MFQQPLGFYVTARDLESIENGACVSYCGIVTLRQQPETAKGTVFVSLEDETGDVQCGELLASRLTVVYGNWQREGTVTNLAASRLEDLTLLLGRLASAGVRRDFP